MINAQMTEYKYYPMKENEYGEAIIDEGSFGTILIAINLINQAISDNPLYTNATYIGITFNKEISDKHIVKYGNQKLKVLYVNPIGRYKQVYMATMV